MYKLVFLVGMQVDQKVHLSNNVLTDALARYLCHWFCCLCSHSDVELKITATDMYNMEEKKTWLKAERKGFTEQDNKRRIVVAIPFFFYKDKVFALVSSIAPIDLGIVTFDI